MANVSTAFSYNDYVKVLKDVDFTTEFTNLLSGIGSYQFIGFTPTAIFKLLVEAASTANITPIEFIKEMAMACCLFYMRGPNISNYTANNTSGGANSYKKALELINRYSIAAKPGRNPMIVTLPRISIVFPALSNLVYDELEDKKLLNLPVSESKVTPNSIFLFPNYVPCLLDPTDLSNGTAGKAFFIHCIYQAFLTSETFVIPLNQRGILNKPTPSESFTNATKYAVLSNTNSIANTIEKVAFSASIKDKVANITTLELKLLIDRVFSVLPSEASNGPTKYHYVVNYCIIKSKKISDFTVADYEKSEADLRTTYPI